MGVLVDSWAWLDTNSKQIGALSSIVFGLSSAAVAWFAYRLNKRNNWGDKPQVWVPTLGGKTKGDREFTTFKGEVWNRRKYTIYPRLVWVKVRGVDVKGLLKSHEVYHGQWFLRDDGWFILSELDELAPQKKMSFEGEIPVPMGKSFVLPYVRVDYFDPVAVEHRRIRPRWRRRLRFWRWHGPMRLKLALRGKRRRVA